MHAHNNIVVSHKENRIGSFAKHTVIIVSCYLRELVVIMEQLTVLFHFNANLLGVKDFVSANFAFYLFFSISVLNLFNNVLSLLIKIANFLLVNFVNLFHPEPHHRCTVLSNSIVTFHIDCNAG